MDKRFISLIACLATLLGSIVMFTGCSGTSAGPQNTGKQYYDMYMDRPGYYDFNQPVITVPE